MPKTKQGPTEGREHPALGLHYSVVLHYRDCSIHIFYSILFYSYTVLILHDDTIILELQTGMCCDNNRECGSMAVCLALRVLQGICSVLHSRDCNHSCGTYCHVACLFTVQHPVPVTSQRNCVAYIACTPGRRDADASRHRRE